MSCDWDVRSVKSSPGNCFPGQNMNHEIAVLKAKISTVLRDADQAELYSQHTCAMKHIAEAAMMIRQVRDLEELEAQEAKHDLAQLLIN